MRVTGSAIRRRLVPVLRDDECAAVCGDVSLLGRVPAVVEDQVAGLRTGRDGDRVVARAHMDVAQSEHDETDDDEGDDASRREGSLPLAALSRATAEAPKGREGEQTGEFAAVA